MQLSLKLNKLDNVPAVLSVLSEKNVMLAKLRELEART